MIKKIEERYIKLTHKEHILTRPETYIGSIQKETKHMFIASNYEDIRNVKMEYKEITYVPGFIKIFDEIITNASDHSIRTGKVTFIKVNITEDFISIENDGPGIPVVIHAKEKVYVPELIFGHLLTGENYDDTEQRFIGGRNGYGAKLTNIFSKKFIVETGDGNKNYHQTFTNNMSAMTKAKTRKSKQNFTKITYYPDFDKFNMGGIDETSHSILIKRVLDIAAYNPGIRVSLNGRVVPVKSFRDYMKLFTDDSNIYYEKIDEFWEIGVAQSPSDTFTHVSMVNGIATIVGGTHVNFVSSMIVNSIKDILTKTNKDVNIKPIDIRNRILIFVSCKLVNPVFDNQTKENLTSRLNGTSRNVKFSDSLLKRLSKAEMFSDIIELSKMKQEIEAHKELNKVTTKRIKVDKLVDANKAGGIDSEKCYLFLTEGDSAKSLAIAGFSQIGRDYYGAFPLKGKPLNVRDISISKIKENDEIKNIIQILGLEFGKKYKNAKSLRYGKVVIMSDSDIDGYHIKGLIINLFNVFWPELLKIDFLYEFVTPILRVSSGSKKKFFYKISDYIKWLELNNNGKGWTTKYYKGLGTIEPVLGKQFFKDIDKHLIKFNYSNPERTEDLIDLVFRSKRADERKEWLLNYKTENFVDKFSIKTTYESFIDNEYIEWSMADNIRSIPSLIDGLKPSQRKILYTLFKIGGKGELNVGELFGLVKAHAAYHHGPKSLEDGIINMAQDYVGSNNISLLEPIGGFGTRLSGGKDCSASRYIYTKLKDITKLIFMSIDNDILDYRNEDSKSVEPYYYVPIVPHILLNGSEGIGTGWSTLIPQYKIEDLVDYVSNKLIDKKKNIILYPYYEGFKGDIIFDEDTNTYISKGIIERVNMSTLNIIELPIGVWNDNYYPLLDKLIDDKFIRSYTKNCTDTDVNIEIKIARETLSELTDDELINKFKLISKINASNMHLFDKDGKIKKYNNVYEIIDEYFQVRLNYYDKRKEYLLNKLNQRKLWFDNVIRFIDMVIKGKIVINNKKLDVIIKSLDDNNFDKVDDSYNYLLNISIYKFSKDELDKLNNDYKNLLEEIKTLTSKDNKQLWKDDLIELKKEIRKIRK